MKIWWNLLLMIGLMACRQEPAELTEMIDPGVSQELAQFRKSTYWDVKYNLSFVIPENKQEAERTVDRGFPGRLFANNIGCVER